MIEVIIALVSLLVAGLLVGAIIGLTAPQGEEDGEL